MPQEDKNGEEKEAWKMTISQQDALKTELVSMMKDAAFKFGCDVSELKCRIDNMGQVEVARMSESEMLKRESKRQRAKSLKALREMKGLN